MHDGDTPLGSAHLARSLAQQDRRRLFAALVLAECPLSTAELADATSLSLRTVVDAVDRLVTAGLVLQDGDSFVEVDGLFEAAARSEVVPAPPSPHRDQPADVQRVLDLALRDGRLVQWPAKRSKRRIVLDHLAQQFEIGERYTEPEVNDLLRPFNDDVATSRRYLVDEEFLDRGEGRYWRCGGTI